MVVDINKPRLHLVWEHTEIVVSSAYVVRPNLIPDLTPPFQSIARSSLIFRNI